MISTTNIRQDNYDIESRGELKQPLMESTSTQSSSVGHRLISSVISVTLLAGLALTRLYGGSTHYLRSENPPSILSTTSESLQQMKEINNTPYRLELTSSSMWGGNIYCYNGEEQDSCLTSLDPLDSQIIAATDQASSSDGLGVDYNLYDSTKYIQHMHINYKMQNGVISPELTNNAGGMIQLTVEEDAVYIQEIAVPSLSPVTSPPTSSYQPSLQPTKKPSQAPSIASPTISPAPTPPPNSNIEQSVWEIDWTAWPPFSIPTGVNLINIFVGKFIYEADGTLTLGGFGNLDSQQLTDFVTNCQNQTPPIPVKVSIGGWGGDKSYDLTWDLLTEDNIDEFANATIDFCRAHGLAGADFDYEEFKSSEQETLVGRLIARVKELAPDLQVSLCSNAGTNWQAQEKIILDAAVTTQGKCPIDRFYIMSYYNSIEEEESWITNWASWLKDGYNCGPEVVGVGIDDFDAHAYDPEELKAWALSNGYSTAHWAYDPAHPSKK